MPTVLSRLLVLAGAALPFACRAATTVQRFPRPEFDTGHQLPTPTAPPPRVEFYEWLDVAVLLGCLLLVAYLVLHVRRRRPIALTGLFALIYFGFWRQGCVCPIGAIQNLVLGACDATYAVPVAVAILFTLPILAALFFGRVFCSAVCPLGVIQDIVILRPVAVPAWLEKSLGMFRHVFLAAGVLLAATGAQFLICRTDPFVGIFRLGGSVPMLAAGALLLLIGTRIGRPYCRFICPYGLLLGWASRVSWRRARITPDTCVQCRLCEESCPFGAIRRPTPSRVPESRATGVRRLALLFVVIPVVVLVGGLAGRQLAPAMARVHPRVALAERVRIEDAAEGRLEMTVDSEAFRTSGTSTEDLYGEAARITRRFHVGGTLMGMYLALACGAQLVGLSVRHSRKDYEPDSADCLACGRCFEYCPREHVRRKPETKEA